jgi:hypothetical protein
LALLVTSVQAADAPPRLPANANVIMKVELAKMLESPLAKEMQWQAKLSKGYADRPLAVPPMAKGMTIVAGMHPVGMRAIWQAAVIDLGRPVKLDAMLKAQGGYLDQIGGKAAAWTPRDVFYVEFDKTSLGVLRPGQRQFLTRWITGKDQPELSPFLKQAWTQGKDADVLFAMDLDDVIGPAAIAYADSMGQLASLEKLENSEKLFGALASVQGLRVSMKVGKAIEANATIDFAQDVSALGDQAKAFVMDVLSNADVSEPSVENWQFKAQGKQIIGTGAMEPGDLVQLIAILAPAHAADAVAAEPKAANATPAGDSKQEAAYASQQYFRAVSRTLDTISGKSSPSQAGSSFVNKARQIEQLPILNVDPVLVEWGNGVAAAFNNAAQELYVGQQKAGVASQAVLSPTAYSTYAPQGSGNSTPETRAAYRNAQQQRRAASQAERGAAGDRAMSIMNQVLPTRGKVRAEMTQKYGVEF